MSCDNGVWSSLITVAPCRYHISLGWLVLQFLLLRTPSFQMESTLFKPKITLKQLVVQPLRLSSISIVFVDKHSIWFMVFLDWHPYWKPGRHAKVVFSLSIQITANVINYTKMRTLTIQNNEFLFYMLWNYRGTWLCLRITLSTRYLGHLIH